MSDDKQIKIYREAVKALLDGEFEKVRPLEKSLPPTQSEITYLGKDLLDLSNFLEKRFTEVEMLAEVTSKISSGHLIQEIIDHIFNSFSHLIPYDRIGVSLLVDNQTMVRATYARSNAAEMMLKGGYQAALKGSSLEQILLTGNPRIINDLEAYMNEHPTSESTRLVFKEGVRSSLTCPLISEGKHIGFIFFSSFKKDTYKGIHIKLFLEIASYLSVAVEKAIAYQRLIELNEQKNRLLGMAAHDLRNPLSTIISYLDMVKEGDFGKLPSKLIPILDLIQKSSEQMITLIEDLLDFSIVEAGKVDLRYTEISLPAYLNHVRTLHELLASKKGIRLIIDLEESLPHIEFDKGRIDQVMSNLITNAIKFSLPNKEVTLGAKREDGTRISLYVKDEGQGIPEMEIHKLFGAFSKLSVKPTGNERSTGIGLSIAKRMVELHGGSIKATSQVGKGSTFTVSLPIMRP